MALRKKKAEAIAEMADGADIVDAVLSEEEVRAVAVEYVDSSLAVAIKELELAFNSCGDINVLHGQVKIKKAIEALVELGKDLPKVVKE